MILWNFLMTSIRFETKSIGDIQPENPVRNKSPIAAGHQKELLRHDDFVLPRRR